MNKMDEFLSTLNPSVAKTLRMAQEVETKRLPLASERLTRALGGGIGVGRFTVVYGNNSAGKSLLCQQSVALWQNMGLVGAWVDAEGAWDKEWAERLGVDNNNLIMIDNAKSFGKITDKVVPLLKNGLDYLVIDSISDIMPDPFLDDKGELNDYNGMKQVGAHAKGNTKMLNALHYVGDNTAIVLISQTTTQIEKTFVKQVPHGGKKMEFIPSQIIKVTSSNSDTNAIKKNMPAGDKLVTQQVGRKVDFVVEKNKLGRQSIRGSYDMYYYGGFVGIDSVGEVVDMALDYGIITGSTWLAFNEHKWNGRPKTIEALRENPDIFAELQREIDLVVYGLIDSEQAPETEEDDE